MKLKNEIMYIRIIILESFGVAILVPQIQWSILKYGFGMFPSLFPLPPNEL